jgi:hypothetical protein
MSGQRYGRSQVAREASDYYNALPIEERRKLAPLLENYRQMGLAEAADGLHALLRRTDARIRGISTEPSPSGHRLYVNDARTILVTFWDSGEMTVAMREDPGAIWGPPIDLTEDRP